MFAVLCLRGVGDMERKLEKKSHNVSKFQVVGKLQPSTLMD